MEPVKNYRLYFLTFYVIQSSLESLSERVYFGPAMYSKLRENTEDSPLDYDINTEEKGWTGSWTADGEFFGTEQSWTQSNELSTIVEEENNMQPYFENTTQRSIIAAVGRTAKLHCKVRNLGDRAVSWIRKRDLHILTIGIMTYTNDQRFQAMHLDDTDEWILKIVSVQPRDSGIYECQVSTEPKISQAYRLTVVVSKAKILANPELFFKSGSDINLTCIATQAPAPPSYIYWYKDGDLINYSQRGGINVLTERQTKTSKLVIARVVPSDSGNYTCTPSNSNSDSVYVHVIKSEHRAAMQHEHANRLDVPNWIIAISSLFYILRNFHILKSMGVVWVGNCGKKQLAGGHHQLLIASR